MLYQEKTNKSQRQSFKILSPRNLTTCFLLGGILALFFFSISADMFSHFLKKLRGEITTSTNTGMSTFSNNANLYAKHGHPLSVRVYTHNVRYDNNALWEGERPWSERKYYVASSIKFNGQSSNIVVTLQEVLNNQLNDLQDLLGNEWTHYGVGREDGKTKGEFSPIFWKKTDWELLEAKTFWLSETPEQPSKGWDAQLERVVTWVHLQHHETKQKINVFSTHFDHQGVVARRESTKLIISKTKSINDDPSFFGGDFNTEPSDEPYQIASEHLLDASKQVTEPAQKYGHYGDYTYTGFDGGIKERAKVIDYLWVEKPDVQKAKNYFLKVETFGILHSQYNDVYSSDHRPLVTDAKIFSTKDGEPLASDKDYVFLFKPKEEEKNKVLSI